nr:Zinc finger, CCHC-type [Ipomoea batatas]
MMPQVNPPHGNMSSSDSEGDEIPIAYGQQQLGARCNLSETAEQQTARYIAGLRFNIQERMTLSPIWSVDEAYNMAIKAEALFAQANQRRQYTPALPKTISTIPPQNSTTHQPITQHTQTTESGHSKTQRQRQEGNFQPQNTTSNPYAKPFVGKCFKCGETGHRSNECRARRSVNLIEENTGEEDEEFHEEDVEVAEEVGEHLSFVVQRLLYTAEDKSHVQRNRIFRAYCNILGKVCKLIIDNGSCDNIISKALVQHLNLPTKPHPKPYKLGWIKDGPSVTVSEVCLVPVSIGKSYEDVVACEVIEMNACHILLGRPWQFDVDATHHGRDNTYSFVWKSKKIIIPPAPWAELKIQNTCAVTIRMNPTENDFGPVVYPKQPMPANEFYLLLGVDSRDLKGRHAQKMSLYKEKSKPRLSPKGYGYFKTEMANRTKSLAVAVFLLALVSVSLVAEARPLNDILKVHSLGTATGAGNGWGFDWFTIGSVKDGPSPGVGHAFTDGGIKSSGPSPGIGHKYVTGTRH